MRQLVLYIHGKGGNAMEADHYKTLFAGYDVVGLDYHADSPWDAIFNSRYYIFCICDVFITGVK